MEFRDLKIFQSVARIKNITAAAKSLNYVQSNVTAHIKQLEQELNTVLFHRHARGISLTGDGQKFLEKVDKILKEFEELNNLFKDESSVGFLNIGTVDTVHPLPMLLAGYYAKYPNVDISLKTDVSNRLMLDVLNYKLDGAFVTGPIKELSFEQYEVTSKTLTLVTNQPTFKLQDLNQETFLVFGKGCGYRAMLEKWLEYEGFINNKFMEFNMLEMILHSVSLGLGVTLLPITAVGLFSSLPNIYCHEIPEEFRQITTIFIRNKNINPGPAMRNFIKELQVYK
ncbi:LysR family transcriptional regulator [Bacillus cereus]|uniref:LysR family transcriptional regulator n=1 Tax=Bacillus TaxID=1386 RepID=UPI000349419A|nr:MULTISPECIES: LysR family transcriptional regulator [Bacillus cereus group]MCH5449899.1 LysR family transcriptional regulator [Bacillus cereus]MCU5026049.1 LysR family transcriptional regulator [Bacillus cereus]MCU5187173.1 LysR family transcriptional regulator [Bacillus cereus]MDA2644470.1 LysR family transcriptional regulator [Bacillus cereus]PFA42198.1 LysR family transcriptional regulator [Bacillus cereus]